MPKNNITYQKYNIATVSNEGYKDFLKVFLNSLFDNADSDSLESVFVFDTGLSEETKKNLQVVSEKIQFVDTDLKAESNAVHDEGWAKNTYSKTKFLFYALNSTQQPCFLIDVDCVFQSNFEKEINWGSDFSVCWRGDNHPISDHLGSFFGATNVAKSLLFLKIWRMQLDIATKNKELFELKGLDKGAYGMKHLESPSLSYCIKSFNGFFDCHNIEEDKISCVKVNPFANVYHLKSDGFAVTIQERLNLPYAKEIVDKYV